MRFGSHRASWGKTTSKHNKITIKMAKGTTPVIITFSGYPMVKASVRRQFIRTSCVSIPIPMKSIRTTPNHAGSKPRANTMGDRIGRLNTIKVSGSMKQPRRI